MKNALIGLLSIAFLGIASAQNYTAEIVLEDIYWKNHNEWWSDWHSVLYLNGVVQPPSEEYYYRWWFQENGEGDYFVFSGSGYGRWETGTDNDHDEYFTVYVEIIIPTDPLPITVVSEEVVIGKWGDPEEATLWARKEDGTLLEGFDSDSIGLWSGYTWHWNFPTVVGNTSQVMSDGDAIKIRPNIEGLGQKFHRGITKLNAVRYQNYDSYPVHYGIQNELTFHHRRIYETTLRAEVLDAPAAIGEIQFKDPWLEDVLGYGGEYASQGAGAPFNSQPSPWAISIDSDYHGVMLNQPYGGASPFYLVGAPNPNNFELNSVNYPAYFQSWTGSNVQFQNITVSETGIVFTGTTGNEATAHYKAYLRSSSTVPTATSGQRKIIRDVSGTYHMVYESAHEIWYSKSTDGTNWSPEILASEGDPSYYNRSPSITVQDNPHLVIVVWEGYLPDNSERGVLARSINPVSGSLGPLESVSSATGNFSTMPVVGAGIGSTGSRYVLCAWFDGSDNKLKGAVRNTSGTWNGPTVIRSGVISEISVTPISPSSSYQNWGLAWTESGTLYYMGILVNSSITPGSVETVATGSEVLENRSPSVAHGVLPFSAPAIAWEEWHHELARRVIKYRERHKATGWSSTITTWQKVPGPSNYQTPTLSPNHQSQFKMSSSPGAVEPASWFIPSG